MVALLLELGADPLAVDGSGYASRGICDGAGHGPGGDGERSVQ